MNNVREWFRGLNDEQAADVYREAEMDKARRKPAQAWGDKTNEQFFREADELCRQADRARAGEGADA